MKNLGTFFAVVFMAIVTALGIQSMAEALHIKKREGTPVKKEDEDVLVKALISLLKNEGYLGKNAPYRKIVIDTVISGMIDTVADVVDIRFVMPAYGIKVKATVDIDLEVDPDDIPKIKEYSASHEYALVTDSAVILFTNLGGINK